jgi:uncharacterized protein YndB with AHSA1/START domain
MKKPGTVQVSTPSDREVAITRVFDAPRRMVYDAHTKPELLKQWAAGPPGWSMAVCEVDLRVGGAWRWVLRGPDGAEMAMHGVHLEVVAPERIARTEIFEPQWYPGEAVSTLTLTEKAGKTSLTVTVRYDSKATRDAVLKSPMDEGMSQGYDKLDEVLRAGTRG